MAGLTGMGFSAAAIIVGTIMRFAVSVQTTGLNIAKVGLILMIAGAIGFATSRILFFATRRAVVGGTHDAHRDERLQWTRCHSGQGRDLGDD